MTSRAREPRIDDVCVVVRMFNEESTVSDVVDTLLAHFAMVVCVDDGSTDSSAAVARRAGAVVLRHPINLGAGAALRTGLDFALTRTDAQYVLTFDADGQHLVPDAVRLAHEASERGLDALLGSRFLGTTVGMTRSRRALLRLAASFTRLTSGVAVSDPHNGLRVFSRRFAASVPLTLPGMGYASEIVGALRSGDYVFGEAPVTILYTDYSRSKGQSNLNAVNIAFELTLKRLGFAT